MIDYNKAFIKLLDVHTANWIKYAKFDKLLWKFCLILNLFAFTMSFQAITA